MLRSFLIALLVLTVATVAAIFAALNPGPIRLDLAFGTAEVEKSLAIIAALAAGWVLGLACAGFGIARLRFQRRSLERALRLAEQEVQALRTLPVRDAD